MFRRLPGSLPEDPSWDAELARLGYFVNEKAQIRQVKRPTDRFLYKITDNDRFNDRHKEAFHKCLRKEIMDRMKLLGAPALFLPQMTIRKPDAPSVPIFTTRQEDLSTKNNVIIIVNDFMQELGVWAYRTICDESFDAGSCIGTVTSLKLHDQCDENGPGLIVFNPGECYYSHKENRSLGHESWEALARKSVYHPSMKTHEVHNFVPASRNRHEHIATVFDKVINNQAYVREDAGLYIVGLGEGGNSVLSYLDRNWPTLNSRVKAAVWVHPYSELQSLKPSFARFVETRTRAWVVSNAPPNTCVGVPGHDPRPARPVDKPRDWDEPDDEPVDEYICPTFAGGEAEFMECVFPRSCHAMLEFFDEVMTGDERYVNPEFQVVKPPNVLGADDDSGGDDHVGDQEICGAGTSTAVKQVDKTGMAVPCADAVGMDRESMKEMTLGESEVKVAGITIVKDLLDEAGLD